MMMIQVSIMVKRLSSFKRVMIVGVHFVDLNNVCNLFFSSILKKETKKFKKQFILKASAKVFCAKRWSSNFHSGPRCSAFKSSVESQSLRDLGNETSFTLTQQYARNEYCNTNNNDHKTHVKDRLSMPCQLNCVETNNNRFGNMTFFLVFHCSIDC